MSPDGYYGLLVTWNGDPETFPLDVSWQSDEVIRFAYCNPAPLFAAIKPRSTVGVVYAEYVRKPDCRTINVENNLDEVPIPVF
ncbi:hypothetical protein HK107_04625 [Parvularcula sp. ZS-1/3]|uniref:Uncharacterized protein n=1 Tax=Parvularcula mediterranea TaxID=2732508 RepID=A0A7Y3RK79_9PROT|nr:hypothetical protein [Parvularcula mediterranea]NNU15602.1 hypothetical protein [Parvularcula mediterranea]